MSYFFLYRLYSESVGRLRKLYNLSKLQYFFLKTGYL